jgi:hypothetical protein
MDVAVMVLKGMKFHQRCGSYYVVVIYVMLYHWSCCYAKNQIKIPEALLCKMVE